MQTTQYRNYPQATTRSPHGSANRRGPGPLTGVPPPHTVNAAAQQQLQMQQAADAHRRELGKRIARKPTDKNLPDGVEDIMIGDSVQEYRKLRDVEKRLDSVMMRKRLDITDSMNRSMTRYRTMRIWISNTAENQPWQQGSMETDVFDFTSENNATYKVRIEGRLLDDDDDGLPGKEWDKGTNGEADEDQDAVDQDGDNTTKRTATKPASTSQRTKLSHFFKSIIIDFDRSKHLQPDGFTQIEWKRPTDPASQEANFDSLEFERKSDENINVTVNLVRDDQPERFRLSKPLAELLDTEEDERANVMMGIWNYIKAQNLQEDEDTRRVQCDARLKAVFSTESIFFPHLPQYITHHLSPVPALQLPYTIRVDQAYISASSTSPGSCATPTASSPTIYDILVPVPDPFRETINSTIRSPLVASTLRVIQAHDEHIASTVQAIGHAKAKHAFFTSMSRDPVGFVKRWTSSQTRDLEVIMGEATRGGGESGEGEEWRRGGVEGIWGGEKARESVGLWLARPKTTH